MFSNLCFFSWVEQDPLELLESVEICIKVTFYNTIKKFKDYNWPPPKPGSYRAVEEGWGLVGQAEGPWDHQPERNYCSLAQVIF